MEQQGRYSRNRIHISDQEQEMIRECGVFIAGCGIGSYIAESLLRLGFENLTIVDGDVVELTNVNRQNYTESDIGLLKAEVLRKRLLTINSSAKINVFSKFITEDNLTGFDLASCKVAINALDFSTRAPFLFDDTCTKLGIPVIHPYNLGWAGFATVITKESRNIRSLDNSHKVFELNVGQFIVESLKDRNIPAGWLEDFLLRYKEIAGQFPPPQLSIGLFLLSGLVSHVIFDIATRKPVKEFPDFYYLSLLQ
ncbi:MAG: ThiF family adenylyltransferase [Chitinophagaceae bacterium]|nr:ThiF family adenylyltransferase [Chitinophagaceae bacterium]